MIRPATIPALLLLAACLTGCGGGTHLYPVTGTVVWANNDQPAWELAGYIVTFESVEGHPSATGVVDDDAKFHLMTRKANDGAAPGQYKVTLTPPATPYESERQRQRPKGPPVAIDPRYQNPAQTDLQVTIEPRSQEIKLSVKPVRPHR